jgi:zinc protease
MNKNLIVLRFTLILTLILVIDSCSRAPVIDRLKLPYEKYVMPNGLQVILHTDHSDPVISYAIGYG